MKLLLSADLHIFAHKKSHERLQDCLNVLDWIFTTAAAKAVDHVIIAGDLFHDRYKIDVPTYQLAFELFQKHCEPGRFHTWLLVGNHDMWYHQKWDFSSVIPFSGLAHVTAVNCPSVRSLFTFDNKYCNVAFLPYTADPIEALKIFEQPGVAPAEILVGHLAIDGACLNPYARTRSEIMVENDGEMIRVDAKIFQKYKQVFLGHYHSAQVLNGNVEYLGSPLQLSFGEAFQNKHIVIYDTDADMKEYISNDFSPKHFIIRQSEADQYPLQGNFLKLLPERGKHVDVIETRKEFMEQHGVKSFEIKPMQRDDDETEVVMENTKALLADEYEITRQFIEECEKGGKLGHLQKDKLLRLSEKVIKEANETILE